MKKKTETIRWLFIAAALIFLAEVIFSGPGILIGAAIGLFLILAGKKRMPAANGTFMLWAGVFVMGISLLQSFAFYLVIAAIIIYFISSAKSSEESPNIYQPIFYTASSQEDVLEQKTLFTNSWFGNQRTGSQTYQWHDTNIQTFVGDTVIDLNYTVLPKEEAVIVIRKGIGDTRILVPYDIEVDVHHSIIYGQVSILNFQAQNVWNKVIRMQTKGYETSRQRVKIVSAAAIGKLEVVRV